MKLSISSIADRGDPQKERLVLKASGPTDVGEYIILRAGVQGSAVTTDIHDAFWFPDKDVDAGDLVVIYTKPGNQSEKALKSGHRAHFFYWGLSGTALWKQSKYAPVLLHSDQWTYKLADD